MEPAFWHRRWEAREIGFHEGRPNALLVKHFPALALPRNARVYVPLCGKTNDIHWLLASGFRVTGAELSSLAVEELFDELGSTPSVSKVGRLKRYSSQGIDIFQGDILEVTRAALGPVDVIYDRAALVALPTPMRDRYAAALVEQTNTAPQLAICFEYDQTLVDGPPFSVPAEEVRRLYGARYEITLLERVAVAGGLRGHPANETAWMLRKRAR